MAVTINYANNRRQSITVDRRLTHHLHTRKLGMAISTERRRGHRSSWTNIRQSSNGHSIAALQRDGTRGACRANSLIRRVECREGPVTSSHIATGGNAGHLGR